MVKPFQTHENEAKVKSNGIKFNRRPADLGRWITSTAASMVSSFDCFFLFLGTTRNEMVFIFVEKWGEKMRVVRGTRSGPSVKVVGTKNEEKKNERKRHRKKKKSNHFLGKGKPFSFVSPLPHEIYANGMLPFNLFWKKMYRFSLKWKNLE